MGLDLTFNKYKGNKKVSELWNYFHKSDFIVEHSDELKEFDYLGNDGWDIVKQIFNYKSSNKDDYLIEITDVIGLIFKTDNINLKENYKDLKSKCNKLKKEGYRILVGISY